MYTRKQYMDHECTHRQYYGQFVTNGTKARVLHGIGLERLMASKDKHLNDIPLAMWDRLVPKCPGSAAFGKADGWYSLAGGVCLLKEAARQIIEENTIEVTE